MVKLVQDDDARAATQPLSDSYSDVMPRPRTGSAPGTLLAGRYRLIRPLGSGGMGTVYEGEHALLGHHVAVKMLHPQYAQNEASTKRFMNEARAAAQLRHPNVARCDDVGLTSDGQPFLILELLQGRDLADELAELNTLDVARALNITKQIASALGYAHQQGIVHRDLKPENVFLTRAPDGSDHVKVLDFGVARFIGLEHTSGTRTGAAIGTPLYMSPEQFMDASRVDARSDIYGLSVVLYEMLTGRRPYEASTLPELLSRMSSGTFQPLGLSRPEVPEHVIETIHRGLSADPATRPDSMSAFVAGLNGQIRWAPQIPEIDDSNIKAEAKPAPLLTLRRGILLIALFALGAGLFLAFRKPDVASPHGQTQIAPEPSTPKAIAPETPVVGEAQKPTPEVPKSVETAAPSTSQAPAAKDEIKTEVSDKLDPSHGSTSGRKTDRKARREKRKDGRAIADEPDF